MAEDDIGIGAKQFLADNHYEVGVIEKTIPLTIMTSGVFNVATSKRNFETREITRKCSVGIAPCLVRASANWLGNVAYGADLPRKSFSLILLIHQWEHMGHF